MEHCAPNPRRGMRYSLPFSPPFLLPNKPHSHLPFIGQSSPFMASRAARRRRSCSLAYSPESRLEASWIHADGGPNDGFGGWSISKPEIEDGNALPKLVIVGVGTSMAILLAAFSFCSFSRRGFKFQIDAPFHTLYELLLPSESTKDTVKDTESPALEDTQFSMAELDDKANMASDSYKVKESLVSGENKRIAVPFAADSIQQEALFVLKKLKIIENDASANEFCTRREYARWLVKANSMLERNPKFRIVPLISIAGSMVTAFDDVSVDDPDFRCIQALGEVGIVPSKLVAGSSSDCQGSVDFSPERPCWSIHLLLK